MSTVIRTTLEHWRARPVRASSLLVLIVVLTFGGPAACVAHCLVLDAAHHQQRVLPLAHQHHALGGDERSTMHPACADAEQQHQHQEHAEPSALTVAIVLSLLLLTMPLAESFRGLATSGAGLSIALSPPRRPPRLAHS